MVLKKQYLNDLSRIEELLKIVTNQTLLDDKNLIELDGISKRVEKYESENYKI
jgi:hypothetical protein